MALAKLCISLALFRINVAWALQVAAPSTAHSSRNASRQLELDFGLDDASTNQSGHCSFDTALMAECTELLYRRTTYCGCWKKITSFINPSKITTALFHHGHHCLLGISGQTNGAEQFKRNFVEYFRKHDPVLSETLCGRATVHGFAKQAKKLFMDPEWEYFANVFASDHCSDGVTVLGTSWGGAIAEILAGCANQGRLGDLQGSLLPSFQVSQLFTFGAPPTALAPIYNFQTGSGGCFPGQRVFLSSGTAAGPTDLVAYSTAFNTYEHAHQDAVQLVKLPSGYFDVKVHRCGSYESTMEPAWDAVYPVLARVWNEHMDAPMTALGKEVEKTHQIMVYVASLRNLHDPTILNSHVAHLMASADANASLVQPAAAKTQAETKKAEWSLSQDKVSEGVKSLAVEISEAVADTR